jgi:hypothetical protein
MEGVTIIVRAIERGWHVALALVVVSVGVIVAHRSDLPELGLFRIEWATIGLGLGTGIVLVGAITRLARMVHSAFVSRRTRIEYAKASKQRADAVNGDLELAKRNLVTLDQEERTLLMDALKRHPFCIEILEFGPSQSLIRKGMLRIVGEGSGTTFVCEVHPWIVAHRNELLSIIEFS